MLLGAALAGCAASSPAIDSSSHKGAIADLRKQTPSARTGPSDDAKCQAYGFQPGTDGYADCRARLRQERSRERAPAK